MPYRYPWAAVVLGAVLAASAAGTAAQSLPSAVAGPQVAAAVASPGSVMTVVDTAQALVQAVVLPAEYGKAKAIALQVQIEGRGRPLLLPGNVQAASAMVQLQARCPSGVWALERLTSYEGPQGTGASRVVGAAPSDQLLWNRLAGSAHAQSPGLLLLWLEQATIQLCASQKPPSRW